MKIGRAIAGMSRAIAVLAYLAAMLVAAYFLTARLLPQLHSSWPGYAIQLLDSMLGLVLFFVSLAAMTTVGLWRNRRDDHGMFRPFVQAMEQMARGDFNVQLQGELTPHAERHFGALVHGFHHMARELGQLEQMRQEFIANVSHELQSPLTSIRGFARTLRQDSLTPEERHHYLDIIEAESTRLSRITEHLLRLAALDADQVPCEARPLRLDRQLRELILACEPQWASQGLELDVQLAEVRITADEDLLSQVWLNLLHNSIKFTPAGGTLQVVLSLRGHEVEVRLTDSGIGIAAEDQPRIFERFYMADRSRTRSRDGSGFGLAIASKIVELHQGTIRVESTPGLGATFVVTLPVAGPQRPADPPAIAAA